MSKSKAKAAKALSRARRARFDALMTLGILQNAVDGYLHDEITRDDLAFHLIIARGDATQTFWDVNVLLGRHSKGGA